jgi:hypothetical protein
MFGTSTFAQVPFAALSGTLYVRAVVETAFAADSVLAVANFAPRITESAQAADQTSSRFSIFSSVSDTAVATDSQSSLYFVGASFSDAAVAADAQSSFAAFLASLTETAVAADAIRTSAAFPVAVFESLLALDTLLGRELWEQIDDTQTPDWTDILVPTTIEDIAVFGGSNFGVTSFAGNVTQRYEPNSVFWVQIDDTQDTVWTDIVAV